MTGVAAAPTGFADPRAIYADARPKYAPPERVPIVPWVETHYVVSRDSGAAQPGPYRFERVPWWREVAEFLADDVHEEGVVAKSSQVGYTELLMAFIAWTMAQDPSSTLMIQPNVEMAEAWSKERLAPVLRDVAPLRGLMRGETQGMARSSDDTLRRKIYPGGWLAIMGANSAAGLASRPVRRVIGDERDRWRPSAGNEGDPLELAKRRTLTFTTNRKIVEGGTPTDEGASPTWEKWLVSDQRHWHVPCPHCREYQPLRWRDETGAYHIVCDRDADGRLIPETAAYRCAHCAALIDESDKAAMVAAGRWVATYPGRRVRGYHIWAAYSPWMTWAEIIREFEAARGSEAQLRVFVNTILGLPFAPAAEKIEPASLHARAEPMSVPPPEVGVLTAGVDVQGDRLEYVVVGWGDREAASVLEYGQVDGDPGQGATWDALTEVLAAPRGDLRVRAACADTGYRPETVWAWATSRAGALFRIFPTKGMDGRGRLLITAPGAVTTKRQRRPYIVGTDTAKDSLAARLRSAVPGPQSVRFADTLPAEYYEHLTAEELRTVYVQSRPVRRWVLRQGRRNEGLDCTLLALAALHSPGAPNIVGPRVIAQLGALAAQRTALATPAPPTPRRRAAGSTYGSIW